MRRWCLAGALSISLLASGAALFAHPGVGIVVDANGNVYYTDLEQVWRISPGGARTIAVPNVHTHELWLDREGNLFGEHLWYEGDATKKWGYRVWRRSPSGAVTDVDGPREGFRTEYSFVRDGAGAMYSFERRDRTFLFRKRTADGVASTLAECHACRDVRWMTAAPDGTLYFVDTTDLYEISPAGARRLRARELGRRTLTRPQAGDRHIVMGLWTDGARNVYAAVYGTGEVKRIAPDGRVNVVARSPLPWSPSGGTIAPNGDLWILEYSVTNAARARRVGKVARSHEAEACLRLLDAATSGVETAVRLFESRPPDGTSAVEAARAVVKLSIGARSALEGARVTASCDDALREELIYLNHLIPGFEGWLAAHERRPPADYELASIIRRARTHRHRGQEKLQ